MRDCSEEELKRIRGQRSWYIGAKCINQRSKVNIQANWFAPDYQIPFLAIVECDSTKRICAPKQDIKSFIESKPFYFIQQQLILAQDETKKERGFPISSTWKSIDYGPIRAQEGLVDISQINLRKVQINKEVIDYLGFSSLLDQVNEYEFYNIQSNRRLQDYQKFYKFANKTNERVLLKAYIICIGE